MQRKPQHVLRAKDGVVHDHQLVVLLLAPKQGADGAVAHAREELYPVALPLALGQDGNVRGQVLPPALLLREAPTAGRRRRCRRLLLLLRWRRPAPTSARGPAQRAERGAQLRLQRGRLARLEPLALPLPLALTLPRGPPLALLRALNAPPKLRHQLVLHRRVQPRRLHAVAVAQAAAAGAAAAAAAAAAAVALQQAPRARPAAARGQLRGLQRRQLPLQREGGHQVVGHARQLQQVREERQELGRLVLAVVLKHGHEHVPRAQHRDHVEQLVQRVVQQLLIVAQRDHHKVALVAEVLALLVRDGQPRGVARVAQRAVVVAQHAAQHLRGEVVFCGAAGREGGAAAAAQRRASQARLLGRGGGLLQVARRGHEAAGAGQAQQGGDEGHVGAKEEHEHRAKHGHGEAGLAARHGNPGG